MGGCGLTSADVEIFAPMLNFQELRTLALSGNKIGKTREDE